VGATPDQQDADTHLTIAIDGGQVIVHVGGIRSHAVKGVDFTDFQA
jgi:hypothetical protein